MAVVVKFLPRAEKDLLALPEIIQNEILSKADLLARFPLMGQRMGKIYREYRYLRNPLVRSRTHPTAGNFSPSWSKTPLGKPKFLR